MRLFCEEFHLESKIVFKKEVKKVEKNPDFEETGKWKIIIKDLTTDQITEEVFDAILICSGLNNRPKRVIYEGQHLFKGRVIHSKEYKGSHAHEGKRVVVIGCGNSGVDIATDLSLVAEKVKNR